MSYYAVCNDLINYNIKIKSIKIQTNYFLVISIGKKGDVSYIVVFNIKYSEYFTDPFYYCQKKITKKKLNLN